MPEPTVATFAARVRAARMRRGMSRETLAHAAGMSYGAIVQVESGRRTDNKVGTVIALADALEVPVDYLLGRPDSGRPFLEHRLLPYASDEDFLATVVPFVETGLAKNEPVLVVTGDRNVALIRAATDTAAVTFAGASPWYQTPPAALAGYQAFVRDQLHRGHHWVRIVGEPIWAERSPGEVNAWTRYEALLNVAFADMAATVVCAYDLREVDAHVCASAELTHPFTLSAGTTMPNESFDSAANVLLVDEPTRPEQPSVRGG